ncbi:MAG: ATP:cob(I)alamin adenosyltransferase [Candidatus Poseidoniia archaeon]|nr:ATP:cob(I)alamin adenosyltransferase [Candidatus Poseidoniia archaeon]
MKIYTRNGDKGETGLLYGGKVSKDSPLPEAYGTVDEAQAVLGLARTECETGSDLENKIIPIESCNTNLQRTYGCIRKS